MTGFWKKEAEARKKEEPKRKNQKGRIKERMEESMSDVLNVSEIFGKNVFNDAVMKDRLPKNVYKKLKKTVEDGAELDPSIAEDRKSVV